MSPGPGTAPGDLARRVEQRLEQAVATLTAASGGASLCSIGRSGRRHPGVKYPEGQVDALRDLRRALARDGDPAQAVATVLGGWRADLERRAEQDPESDWTAYREGGVDALTALAGAAATQPTSAPG